ncbi:MAG TPA: tRNA (adenosine(37)-N6)-threonylcarbamoyltransferase complex dimerization subunit type 1 TsaB [Dysgonamonadaceae bacterium]|nr:tRNA (adenosine(37)-N6)-threonylcarbamoyltransferase complex dimerization subunit type 1 TsaB [Dysgonamonadaceae bacterium]
MNSTINILHIETATKVCSCSLSVDGEIVFNKESHEEQSHAKLLGVFTEEAIQYSRKHNVAVHAIAVSSGPGSYTGLRIGVSEAKGLAFGLDAKLIAISTLKLLASIASKQFDTDVLLCPMIDARRMEVYTSVFDSSLNIIEPTTAKIIDKESFQHLLLGHKVAFFGDGAIKCKELITHPNAIFISDVHPLASGMAHLSLSAYRAHEFEDVAYFEPFYLKDFVATKPKNKVF